MMLDKICSLNSFIYLTCPLGEANADEDDEDMDGEDLEDADEDDDDDDEGATG